MDEIVKNDPRSPAAKHIPKKVTAGEILLAYLSMPEAIKAYFKQKPPHEI